MKALWGFKDATDSFAGTSGLHDGLDRQSRRDSAVAG